MKQTLGIRQEQSISFMWNGRTYNYNEKNIELVDEEVVNGLMGRRVLGHKRWARGGPAIVGNVVGALSVVDRQPYRSMIYLVEKEDNGKIYQTVKVRSVG